MAIKFDMGDHTWIVGGKSLHCDVHGKPALPKSGDRYQGDLVW